MSRILIIDDDVVFCDYLSCLIKNMGHESTSAATLSEGLKEALANPYDVVLLDVLLPDGNGLDIVTKIKETASVPNIIIITGCANSAEAELSIKQGAWDYIEKGSGIDSIKIPLQRALQQRGEKQLRKTIVLHREGIVGNSSLIKQCLNQLTKASESDTAVLITGESGTGKELFARALHDNSSRSGENFVTVDCTSLPETLIESILFGHEKGSFTGADKKKKGLISQANGGTLFLDEIGELPPVLQKTFLRVLQEHRYRPLGSDTELMCNFRLISSTNKNLEEMISLGEFREDLFYRLNTLVIHLPPLRDRKEDIKDISIHYLTYLSKNNIIKHKTFSSDFFETLMAYDWPGNIRELKHALEIAFINSGDDCKLYPQHLPDKIRISLSQKKFKSLKKSTGSPIPLNKSVEEYANIYDFKTAMEFEYLRVLLDICEGDITELCSRSGVSRSGIYKLLKKHNLIKNNS